MGDKNTTILLNTIELLNSRIDQLKDLRHANPNLTERLAIQVNTMHQSAIRDYMEIQSLRKRFYILNFLCVMLIIVSCAMVYLK